jgi:predicted nucleotidyltransferase
MRYKVTAIRPVEILARVRREEAHAPLSGQTTRPAESYKWIYLSAGEVRDGLDLVIAVMASYVPNEPTQFRLGKQTVLLPLNEKLPKVYFGLFELENSTISD